METEQKILSIVENILLDDEARLDKLHHTKLNNFIMELEFDSVEIIQFIAEIEEQFRVDLMEKENYMDLFKDISGLVQWLEGKEK